MASATLPVWVPIALPFAGYAAALATEALRGRQALAREREQRLAERQIARDDLRGTFERDTLLELQDAVSHLMRNYAATMHVEEMRFRETGQWGRGQLPDELGGEPSLGLTRNVQRLRVRVLDEELRDLISQWIACGSIATIGAMREESDSEARERSTTGWRDAIVLYDSVVERIGERIRALVSL